MSEKRNLVFYKNRQLVFAVVIIIIVIFLDIIFEKYTNGVIKNIDNEIEKISNILNDKNGLETLKAKDLMDLSNIIIKDWEKEMQFLTCFIEHEEIEKINVKLHLLEVELKNSLWGDAKMTLNETKEFVKYLKEKYKLSLQNIF